MSWLDRIVAVPVIGVRLDERLWPGSDYLRLIGPLLAAPDLEVSVAQSGATDLEVSDSRAYSIKVESANVAVSYKYAPRMKSMPGRMPQLDYVGGLEKYSTLLSTCQDLVAKTISGLAKLDPERSYNRIGIVANCQVDAAVPVPGLASLLSHLRKPWKSEAIIVEGRLLAIINDAKGERDQCHHVLKVDEIDRPADVHGLSLDFQRVFHEPRRVSNDFVSVLGSVVDAAFRYYARFAEGGLSYE